MTRSPLFYPLNRGMDADAGGAADLQTDVMRFMAILSLCLVAIFALVQSIPLAPTQVPTEIVEEIPEPVVTQVTTPPAPEPEPEMVLTRPEPAKMKPREEPVQLQRAVVQRKPEARAPASTSVESSTHPVSTPSKVQKGFTLRFESDHALNRLVARDVVGLYAITSDKTLRMSIDGGEMSFWPASAPGKFHEMDVATVPGAVVAALGRNAGAGAKWGVTIPAAMSRQLNRFLTEHAGGSLVISVDGVLSMEQ